IAALYTLSLHDALPIFFTTRKALIMRLVAEQLVTYETDIAQGGLVIGHSVNLSGGFFGSGDRFSGQLLIGFVTPAVAPQVKQAVDRKSTRLNSSHVKSS